MAEAFTFLLKLAWESRYRIPLIIAISFMAFDIRMMLEINVQMRRIQSARIHPPIELDDVPILEDYTDSDDSGDSWLTLEEEEIESDEILS